MWSATLGATVIGSTVNRGAEGSSSASIMCEMSGYSRIHPIGSAFPDYFVDSRRAAEGVRLTLDKGAVTNYELTLKKSDGGAILVSFNAAIFTNQSGVVHGIFAGVRDIT